MNYSKTLPLDYKMGGYTPQLFECFTLLEIN